MKIDNLAINFCARKMPNKQAKYFNDQLIKAKNIDIICHEATDRDSANAALSMYNYLKQYGVHTKIIISQNIDGLKLRSKNEDMIQASDIDEKEKPETVLCVDFSAKDRVSKNVLDIINKADNILCLDHHQGTNFDIDYIDANNDNNDNNNKVAPFYIDTSAKSTTSIIYRFFETLNKGIDKDMAYDLFYGLVDDCVKRGYVECDGKNGQIIIDKKLQEDKDSYEVYKKLENMLEAEDISTIARNIDIMCSLSKEEQDFYNSLFQRTKLSENKKVAYVVLDVNDETWIKLGRDNTRTSTILNRYRKNLLKSDDEKFKDVKTVMAFYEAKGNYRVSFHSKENTLDKFYEYALKNVSNPTATLGGHKSRGGGKITSNDPETCSTWASEIIKCSDFYN